MESIAFTYAVEGKALEVNALFLGEALEKNAPEPFFCLNAYTFGFNGMEYENELYQPGNAYDFGARVYDGRIGRWFSVDPLAKLYPSESPYIFSGNSPLLFFDGDGQKKIIYLHLYDEECQLVAVLEIEMDETDNEFRLDGTSNGQGSSFEVNAYDIVQNVHFYADGSQVEEDPYLVIADKGLWASIFEEFGETDGATVKIWGTGANGVKPWNDSKKEPLFEIDMEDPFWGAFFGAMQKGKYNEAVRAALNSERATEGFKSAVEVFKIFNSMESESDEHELGRDGMETEDSVDLYKLSDGGNGFQPVYMRVPLSDSNNVPDNYKQAFRMKNE